MIRGLSGSSENLLPSTPTSSTLFTFGTSFSSFPYTMPVFSETLLAFLNAGNVTDDDAVSVLEEYAWSCIVSGKRVREYCEDLTEVISKLNKPSAVQRLMYTGVLATLFPYIRVTSSYLPSPPPLPSPIVTPGHLPNITRKQLIDSLSKFSTSSPQSLYTEGLIFEVIVEYIGRRWRSGESDIVENISRKLTEVEFEIQVQGDLATVKSTVQPALQKARFLLGFLTVTQMVTRLNAMSASSLPQSDRVRPDPQRLIRAYIVRRLAAGSDPTLVVYDLVAVQDKINSASHKDILTSTITSFGLQFESPGITELGRGSTDTLLAPTSPITSFGPTISPRRATFSRLASKLSSKRHIPPAPKWLSHRKASMSVSKLHPTEYNPDRRPSLPTFAFSSSTTNFKAVKSPLAMASMSSIHTIRRIIPEDSPEWAEVSAATGDLTIRILAIRYRVSRDGGWFLGSGKNFARGSLRAALNDSDCENHQAVYDISTLFDIIIFPSPPPVPRPVTPPSDGIIGERRGSSPVNYLPPPPCLIPLSFGKEGDPISPLSIASFDLDEYYARMSSGRSSSHAAKLSMGTMTTDLDFMSSDPHGDASPSDFKSRKRRSTGLESLMTMNTGFTGFTYGRTSRLSNYSIREATKEWPSTAMATTFSMPLLPRVMPDDPDMDTVSDDESFSYKARPTHRHSRSRSETDLLALMKPDESFSPRPSPFISLRRTRRLQRSSISLSAWDLGLGHVVPTSPTPLPKFTHQAPSDDTDHDETGDSSLLLTNELRPRPSLGLSPVSSTYGTPRAGSFPLPPDALPWDERDMKTEVTPVPHKTHVNRQWTIINGEVSPSRDSGEDGHEYFARPHVGPIVPFPQASPSGQPDFSRKPSKSRPVREKALPVPPRGSSLVQRPSDSPRPLSPGPETPLSLALSLFSFSRLPPPPQAPDGHPGYEIVAPRYDLTVDEVNAVLDGMVGSEKARIKSRGKQWDDAARCKVGWLMDQVGDMLHDPRFAPIIDVHLDRLAPPSLKPGALPPPSPDSLPASCQSSQHLYPSSPPSILALTGHSTLSLPLQEGSDEPPSIPQSSPRPPHRRLATHVLAPSCPAVEPAQADEPRMVPLTPTKEEERRPLPRTPRSNMGSMDSSHSRLTLTSKLSIGTFGH